MYKSKCVCEIDPIAGVSNLNITFAKEIYQFLYCFWGHFDKVFGTFRLNLIKLLGAYLGA